MLKLIMLALVACLLSGPALAYGKAAPVSHPAPKAGSTHGNVTGGDCKTNDDCWQACTTSKGDKLAVTCLSTSEGSSNCSEAEPGPVGLSCECLPDSRHCGYKKP